MYRPANPAPDDHDVELVPRVRGHGAETTTIQRGASRRRGEEAAGTVTHQELTPFTPDAPSIFAPFTICIVRLHHLHPDELDADQRALYDLLTDDGRMVQASTDRNGARMLDDEGRMEGPFNAWLTHADIGWAVQETSRRLRFEGVLTLRIREIVILVVAASQQSDYEWAAHAPIARHARHH